MPAEPLPDSSIYELLLWLLRLRRRVRVTGVSMIPTLAVDDEVLVDPHAYDGRSPDVGDIVVAHRPDRIEVLMVKRVAGLLPDGSLLLQGDNPAASTDSHDFGSVAPEYLVGKVTSRFA